MSFTLKLYVDLIMNQRMISGMQYEKKVELSWNYLKTSTLIMKVESRIY